MSTATVAATSETKKTAIAQISATNAERCNIPQVLDALEITVGTVPSINLYVFELLQNAIDAGAKRVSVRNEFPLLSLSLHFLLSRWMLVRVGDLLVLFVS